MCRGPSAIGFCKTYIGLAGRWRKADTSLGGGLAVVGGLLSESEAFGGKGDGRRQNSDSRSFLSEFRSEKICL